MSKYKLKKGQAGFTLLEMLVVIAIIAALAAMVIPMIGGVKEKAGAAADASNQADLNKQILSFAEMNGGNYPDEVDSLLDASDNTIAYGANAGDERGLYVTLLGMGGDDPFLKPFDLYYETGVGGSIEGLMACHGLGKLGITSVYDHKQAKLGMGGPTPLFPNNSTDDSILRELDYSSTCYIATLDADNVDDDGDGDTGNQYVEAIYDHYRLEGYDTADPEDKVAVFGIGKTNTMVGSINCGIQEAPTTNRFDLNDYYGRYLALYLLPDSMAGNAKLLGVLDARGQLIGRNMTDYASNE